MPEILKRTASASPARLQPGRPACLEYCAEEERRAAAPSRPRACRRGGEISGTSSAPAEAGQDSLKRSSFLFAGYEAFRAELPLFDPFVKLHYRPSMAIADIQVSFSAAPTDKVVLPQAARGRDKQNG